MHKFEGIHFYVNVANFNEVVIDEETKNGKVNHSIHALDTFFSGIESFGKKNFPEKFVIEKITGARLHMYVVDDVNEAYEIVEEVADQVAALKAMKTMAAAYGFDISQPAANAKEAIQ